MKPILFQSFYSRYRLYRTQHVRQASLYHIQAVKNHFFKNVESSPLSEVLSHVEIHRIYTSILKDSRYGPGWKNRMFGVLRHMIGTARKWGYLSDKETNKSLNELENIPEERRVKPYRVWNEAEQRRFLSIIKDEDEKMMFSLFFELGARLSEFLALSWNAYDGRKGALSILAQLRGNSKKTASISPLLKTKESYRVCKLSPTMKEALNKRPRTSPYLFFDPKNPEKPYPKALFRKRFERYIALARLPRITPHAIRHGKATRLVKACKNMLELKAVARYLGHSVSMLLDVYSHEETKTIEAVLRRCY